MSGCLPTPLTCFGVTWRVRERGRRLAVSGGCPGGAWSLPFAGKGRMEINKTGMLAALPTPPL